MLSKIQATAIRDKAFPTTEYLQLFESKQREKKLQPFTTALLSADCFEHCQSWRLFLQTFFSLAL